MKKWRIIMFFLWEEDAQRQEHTWRRQIQRTMSLANLMASNFSLECSFENLGFDTTIVAHDSELNGLKTWQDIGSKTQQVDNMETQQVAKDDYEFQKINWRLQLWFEDIRTLSQTTPSMLICSSMCKNSNLVFLWLHWWNYEWEVCTYQLL